MPQRLFLILRSALQGRVSKDAPQLNRAAIRS